MTFEDWEPIARRLIGAYPNVNASPETVLVYFEQLAEFDADIVLAGVSLCIERSKFFPAVSELLEVIVPEHQVRREWDHLDFSHAGLPSGIDPSPPALPSGQRPELTDNGE